MHLDGSNLIAPLGRIDPMSRCPFRIAVILGTRPEAIKLAPVIRAIASRNDCESLVISTAQHRRLLDQVLSLFEIVPDLDLDLMCPDQGLGSLAARALGGLTPVLERQSPDLVVVQGDTTTAVMGAMAAFYAKCPVAHVEAGLRTFDRDNPFPEEVNRRVITQLANVHFAPTETNRRNLVAEGVPLDAIFVTGNTAVDAVLTAANMAGPERVERLVPGFATNGRALLLATMHRRESLGGPLRDMCSAIRQLVDANDALHVLLPVHPNPNVRAVVQASLRGHARVRLVEPLDYLDFVAAMKYANLILTDSGGIQEEAPSFGTPVLVMREVTERPEAVQVAASSVVGRDPVLIVEKAQEILWADDAGRAPVSQANPFGDGQAARRIVETSLEFLAAKAAPRIRSG